jgi:hypothetical protein
MILVCPIKFFQVHGNVGPSRLPLGMVGGLSFLGTSETAPLVVSAEVKDLDG